MRLCAWVALVLLACEGASSDPGRRALLGVEGATFHPGAMPADGAGPPVVGTQITRNTVQPGLVGRAFRGAVARGAEAVAIGLEGDAGYWILPSGPPDATAPQQLTFETTLSFARALPAGSHALVARAVDPGGRFGAANVTMLEAEEAPADTSPLVVTLRWDTDADLDLHVVDGNGVEIWSRDPNAYVPPPPGTAVDPEAVTAGGILDVDSNAGCVIDGRRVENVRWQKPPPGGHYLIRVNATSLCDEAAARWTVEAHRDGALVGRAFGTATEADVRFADGRGAGLLVMELDLP